MGWWQCSGYNFCVPWSPSYSTEKLHSLASDQIQLFPIKLLITECMSNFSPVKMLHLYCEHGVH